MGISRSFLILPGEEPKGDRKTARILEGLKNPAKLPEGLAISDSVFEFSHPELNQRVDFFGGGYLFVEEGKLEYRGKEVLYLVGMAAIESSCCGTGGCAFIKVPGYIRAWKKRRSEGGQSVSEVERVEARDQQEEIRESLREKHPGFTQVEFL